MCEIVSFWLRAPRYELDVLLSPVVVSKNLMLRGTQLQFYLLFCGDSHPNEGHRLRVSGNRVLRRIFGPKREEVAGGWIRLHSKELHNLYSS
jgi:hypothetical protein